MNKRIVNYIVGLLACFFSICELQAQAENTMMASPIRKLQLAEFAIANLYVDKTDENKLVEKAIIGMLEELDPHSTYSNAEEVKKMNEKMKKENENQRFRTSADGYRPDTEAYERL